MKKGKKIYILEITYDDKTDEITSVYESLEAVNTEMALCLDDIEVSDYPDCSVYLSDVLDEESFELIAGVNIIACA